jgi:hypothetical protein
MFFLISDRDGCPFTILRCSIFLNKRMELKYCLFFFKFSHLKWNEIMELQMTLVCVLVMVVDLE